MKKFIIIAILFTLAPAFATADTLGGLAGCGVGAGLGSLIGSGAGTTAAQIILCLGGANVGSRLEDGTYGVENTPTVTRTYRTVPAYSGSPCPAHWEGNYFMREGYRRAQQGGITRDGCGNVQQGYIVQEVVTTPRSKVLGPTVRNYLGEPMIHVLCKTGNPGADGNCLLRNVEHLALEQKACECLGDESKNCEVPESIAICPTDYNPGMWAGIYLRLGKELIARQKALQGGSFALNQ
ncbi:MAG: hypothetical protein HZB10_02025 [Candidatus Yonathbacteria bacterium]|nr:hypothetical protein [Candidatus Yonathbacteria bacterium]